MRLTLTLLFATCAGSALALEPYVYPQQYSYPMRLNWSYQAWALSNESEFVRKLPDHNDADHRRMRYWQSIESAARVSRDIEEAKLLKQQRKQRMYEPLYPGRLYEW
jgi:hypothetical protein